MSPGLLDRLRSQWTVVGYPTVACGLCVAITIVAVGVVLAGSPGTASAEDQVGLAAPGPCAEPREAITGVGDPSYSVVGSVAALLSPLDVAAAPGSPAALAPPPVSSQIASRGPCDSPDSGCGRLLPAAPTTKPIVPGRPPARKSD